MTLSPHPEALNKRICAAALALALAALAGCSSSERTASPRFTHMDVALNTRDRGKDADTRLEISIVPSEGEPAVAYLDIQGQALAPNSTVSEVVPPSGGGFALDELKHEQIMVRITPGRRSTWNYSYDVILHFSDGTEALLGSGNQKLTSSSSTALLPLSLATVASASTVGRLERFGFRLLSKASPTSAPAVGTPEPPAPAPAFTATTPFTQMIVALTTGDAGKDAGTRLEFLIVPKDGAQPVGYLDVPSLALAPDSTVAEVVPSAGSGFTLGDLNREQIMLKITPAAGAGPWSHKFDAVLHFADGTEALLNSGDQVLGGDRTQELIPLYLANVAPHSASAGPGRSAAVTASEAPAAVAQAAAPEAQPMAQAAAQPAAAPAAAPAPPPRFPKSFTQMDVTLTTRDKGKDPNARLEFFIVPEDGGPPVAYLDVQGQGLAPNSTVAEVVPSYGEGFTLKELKHEQIVVKLTQSGGGPWTYKFDAVLHFANGEDALLSSGDQILSSRRDRQSISLSLASVASANSTFGRLERYTFGLLTPGSHKSQTAPSATPTAVSTKQFTEMDVALTTRDRGKDPGTRLEFFIVPKPGEPAVAYLDVQGQALEPNTTVSEVVPVAGTGFTLADLKHEQVMVKVTPSRRGTWTCRFDVILHFANGSEALLGSGDLRLTNENTVALVPLSDATVASPNIFGSVEKFGFGFLNKIGH
jgi:hypothetical protein